MVQNLDSPGLSRRVDSTVSALQQGCIAHEKVSFNLRNANFPYQRRKEE